MQDAAVKRKCFIGGCTKNCGRHIEGVFENIKKIGNLFDEYHVIIAYDNSADNTLALLRDIQSKIPNMDILVNARPTTHIRTQNIANARNAILDTIKSMYTPEWEYFIMLDCDDICDYKMNEHVLEQYLSRDDWDSLSFNRRIYYDIWALSFDPYIFSCWNWPNAREVVHTTQQIIESKLNAMDPSDLFPCYSAFNGFAIYRTAKFLNCTYEWKIPLHLITEEQLRKHMDALGKTPLPSEDGSDCEHRSFHLQAILKNQAKIRISPLCLFDVVV